MTQPLTDHEQDTALIRRLLDERDELERGLSRARMRATNAEANAEGFRLSMLEIQELRCACERQLAEVHPTLARLARLADSIRERRGDPIPSVRDYADDLSIIAEGKTTDA
jgi:hypothetical protein